MFQSAELGHRLEKKAYEEQVPRLREALLEAQMELGDKAQFPVILVLAGVEGAGKGETLKILNEWMDPRFIAGHALGPPSDEERERPPMWRYWRRLPPKGRIGIFLGSWYTQPILARTYERCGHAELDQAMDRILRFERMLADEGALILKVWLHLSQQAQRERFTELESKKATRWRVTPEDWRQHEHYDALRRAAEHALRQTSTADAPWLVVEGADPRYRHLAVGQALLAALQQRLAAAPPAHSRQPAPPALPAINGLTLVQSLDLSKQLAKKDYDQQLEKYQGRLNLLLRKRAFAKKSLILVFEGFDAAGKGGAIRRVTAALDARRYRILPIAAPSDEERAQPYLWRFWRHLPRHGRVAIFDRSWYGRVLVERVEGYCEVADWMRAYGEINDFEEQLVRNGAMVAKFFLVIDKDEQLKRFKAREQTNFKRFKITEEDWRNREKWDDYEQAVCDMVERTSSEIAPWTLIEANDKRFARVKVLKTLCKLLEEKL
ncbi:polyphosphate:AMP phosphotransferase [Geoalkalibacter halelectricus]|uniref:Polyphosphate:AMP phosphotransferase n=1 Tax=Geoalkalibacter halelectricus TaxID=2847045 RepID=A0ABY5ZLX7_9BACT|nr:polyphosphate:AMP phosphotransferase [Geoalkalibacter halelectricus]MDO3378514.1 polyphosphate:AMP phosphotransferase [Geoalkalibacter halelectricus]UWZ80172.1 polyphosphate:AMP phosphotransferase [Geoalkalibacter halelectricus]